MIFHSCKLISHSSGYFSLPSASIYLRFGENSWFGLRKRVVFNSNRTQLTAQSPHPEFFTNVFDVELAPKKRDTLSIFFETLYPDVKQRCTVKTIDQQ